MPARPRAWFAFVALAAAFVLWGRDAAAHEINVSRGDYRPSPGGAEAWIALARPDLLNVMPSLDKNGDKTLGDDEIVRSEAADKELLEALRADVGGKDCPGEVLKIAPDGHDGGAFAVRFAPCEGAGEPGSELTVHVGGVFAKLSTGHRHAAFVHGAGGATQDSLIHGSTAAVKVSMDPNAAPPRRSLGAMAWECVVLGVEHILTGIDHVVFLIGLVLLGGKLRQLVAMVTSFTVAHSVTLGLTVLGVVAPSASLIEPLIALSVAYVGFENFIVKDIDKRWRIAGVFGLIHGFGFASAVGDRLPRDNVPVALATFNLGVELGQLLLLVIFVPLFAFLHKKEWFKKRGVQALSGAVVLAGLFWFVERVFLA